MRSSTLNRLARLEESMRADAPIISCSAVREGDMWRLDGNDDLVTGLFTDAEKKALGNRQGVFMVTLTVRDRVV